MFLGGQITSATDAALAKLLRKHRLKPGYVLCCYQSSTHSVPVEILDIDDLTFCFVAPKQHPKQSRRIVWLAGSDGDVVPVWKQKVDGLAGRDRRVEQGVQVDVRQGCSECDIHVFCLNEQLIFAAAGKLDRGECSMPDRGRREVEIVGAIELTEQSINPVRQFFAAYLAVLSHRPD